MSKAENLSAESAERELEKQVAARAVELGLATDECRRDGERVPCDFPVLVSERRCDVPVTVAGRAGSFIARCVNISRSGVLLALQYADRVSDTNQATGFGELLVSICRHGAELQFDAAGFALPVELIRAADGEPEEQLLACRLLKPMTEEQRAIFGVSEDA
ncbi:MAG: hypothetical protein ACYTF8_05060 [Planctomycetota bacterium]|jgi:hypothetical protein